MQTSVKQLVIRVSLALVFLACGGWVLHSVVGNHDAMLNAIGAVLLAVAFAILAGIVLAPIIGDIIGSGFIEAFLFPHRRPEPQPKYGIPESRVSQGKYEEAIALYRDITEEFPDHVKPYRDMIDICLHRLNDPQRAEEIYRQGMERLRTDDARTRLRHSYDTLRNDPAHTPPSPVQPRIPDSNTPASASGKPPSHD